MSDGHGDASEEAPGSLTGGAREERARRIAKLDALRARGIDPYPVTYPRDHDVAAVRAEFGDRAPGTTTDTVVRLAGRIMLLRDHGGLLFAQLKDESGTLQLFISRSAMGEQGFADARNLDIGDWVGAEGTVMVTDTGELSVATTSMALIGKALRPLPTKGHGLTDAETRFRQRYMDLVLNPESRRVADVRQRTVAAIREFLGARGYAEVETPVLQSDAGGATARPFITHHNALNIEMYLRIALELYLKRLIAGGYEKVFEMGRVFRNEGLDTRHNPEFTMLEAYEALADYHDMMELTEQMVAHAAMAANGTTVIQIDGQPVDLAPPWRRATMYELIKEHLGIDIHPSMPVEEARRIADGAGVEYEEDWGSGKICDEIYDGGVEQLLVGPIFVCDHPRETSPLARAHRDDPTLVERFEVVVAARELANAYTELTDPVDQRTRFEAEARAKAAGDVEAGDVDEDYLRAMEMGMPPTGGLGVGVDRLVMLLAGAPSIREVILFPTLRPEEGAATPPPALLGSIRPAATSERVTRAATGAAAPAPHHQEERLRLPPPRRVRPERRVILAVLVALTGLATVLVAIPGLHSRFDRLDDTIASFQVRAGGMVAAVIVGFICLLVAGQLARGKRSAWWIAVVLLSIAAIVHLVKGPHPLAVILTVAVLVALVWCREDFTAPPDPPSLWTAVRFVPDLARRRGPVRLRRAPAGAGPT